MTIVTPHYSSLKLVLAFKDCKKASIETQLASLHRKSKHFIRQTRRALEGASLGEIKKEATSGRVRQRVAPLNQFSPAAL